MDPQATKPHSKRLPQDPDQLPPRRPNRLFLSETIPPSIHQHQPHTSQARSHNLSDKIHEYYERLVKNSQLKRSNLPPASHQLPTGNIQQRFSEPYAVERSPITVPRFVEQEHSSISIRTALQPANINARQPYTVYVEDPSAAFQHYKKKPSSNPSGTSFLETGGNKDDIDPETAGLLNLSEKNKSPTSIRAQCAVCHSSNHSSHNCNLHSHIPAEQDGFISDTAPVEGSPPIRSPKVNDENQGDGSEGKKVLSKKRGVPANINVGYERDVIGQEKSPVSKSHPAGSGALSTSSSNGDTVPRERKKWVRPPLVGQAASSTDKSPFINPTVFDCLDDQRISLEKGKTSSDGLQLSSSTGPDQPDTRDGAKGFSPPKSSYFDTSITSPGCIHPNTDDYYGGADRDGSFMTPSQQQTSEGEQGLSDSCAGGRVSPSSSVTSNRRLEWDSGADVGYNQMYGSATPDDSSSGLCAIERMALAQGCSVALHLRLDPEGTTVPASSSGLPAAILPPPFQDKPTPRPMGKPAAESTPLDQILHVRKAFSKHRNDPENMISPITHANKKDNADLQALIAPMCEEVDKNVQLKSTTQVSQCPGSPESSSAPYHRQLSNSMQDLRKLNQKQSENQLSKSQSDPDLSGDAPTLMSRQNQSKFSKGIPKVRNLTEIQVAQHSVSSGSDATLVHFGTEEDLANDLKEDGNLVENPHEPNISRKMSNDVSESTSRKMSNDVSESTTIVPAQLLTSDARKVSSQNQPENSASGKPSKPESEKGYTSSNLSKQAMPSSNAHVCSDMDHKRGLHHHFGVLCSSVVGGHIHSAQPNVGAQLQNVAHGPDRVFSQVKQLGKEASQSPPPPSQNLEILTGESTGSSAFHSDAALEENAPCTSNLTGRANSFEYLPGHMYEKNPKSGSRKHERPPGISTSTETDSEPMRPISRVMHRKMIDSSSHDTEDDRLWASPRVGSNTLVEDLERGVNLLKGVMENKSAGRRSKRELIRRIIKKLVTSEYVEDILEKERIRIQNRSPFSPRKTKFQDRQHRNIPSKRTIGSERQEISGESDEPKQRIHNVRRKIPTHQSLHHPPTTRTHTTLASGSKSSSLWSSHAESTTGSISLSGSSDNHKESKNSVKTNPLYEPHQEKTATWLKPTTQSEKLFEMRKNGASNADKNAVGLIGRHGQEPVIDPIAFKNDPQKQLLWVTNEITHLRILKQLLQKQESLKQSLDPNLCQINYTTMPVTGLKKTMQMADCTSPDIPESRSPKLKQSRMQHWISLESDTSAGFGLSNHTGSSRDSRWQGVEIASAGEQDSHPHRTVSISDNDQTTDVSCSLSNRKSHDSQNSGTKLLKKSRRRSVSISDTDQQHEPPSGSEAPVQKKRSDCHCGKHDARMYSVKPHTATYGPPSRNFSSDKHAKQGSESCTSHTQVVRRDLPLSTAAVRPSVPNRGVSNVSSRGTSRMGSGSQQLDGQKTQPCTCGAPRAQDANCSCSPHAVFSSQSMGAIKKGASGSSHQLVSHVTTDLPASSTQSLSSGGVVRVHIETDHNLDSSRGKSESQRSTVRDRVQPSHASEIERAADSRPASEDSITKAVSEAVSSKVRALRNLGKIEGAEVKIRVKVAPGQVANNVSSHSNRGRVLKSQDLEDESSFYPSKHPDIDDMIVRQRAMDIETRQKLLAIAETRQRAQMGFHDVDRRIQDLLLQDYLSRQFKTPEDPSTPNTIPHARLNVRVEAPVAPMPQSNSIGVQSEVNKKTIGTSTFGTSQRDESYTVTMPKTCVCDTTPRSGIRHNLVNQGQQTEGLTRPQTAPAGPMSCSCSCQSQPASTQRTYHASQPHASSEREVEFELELHKQRPYNLTSYEVHETLKSRNTAYFLQFEEDPTVETDSVRDIVKSPIQVVTVKVPKQKLPGSRSPVSNHPVSSQDVKKNDKNRERAKTVSQGASRIVPTDRKEAAEGASLSDDGLGIASSGRKDSRQCVFHSEVENNISHQAHTAIPPGEDSHSDAASILRITPGRSHLSIAITDSSAESMPSPDGDSMYSSIQRPSRKPQKSPRPSKRMEKIGIGSRGTGDMGVTEELAAEAERNSNFISSTLNLGQHGHSSKCPDNDSGSVYDHIGSSGNSVPTLQEYLERNHPHYLDAAEKRRRCIAEMSYLRRLRQQSRKRLLELEGDNLRAKQKQQWRSHCAARPRPSPKRRSAPKTTKSAGTRRYMFLPERQQRLLEFKKKEEKRTNRLMAEIYTRKLQEKVLKGSATISSSVSVISSL